MTQNAFTKKTAKTAVAAALGVVLLAGGGTYALWTANAPVSSKASITSGDLKATVIPGGQWVDVSNSSSPTPVTDLSAYRIAPGSTLQLTQKMNLVVIGDNLSAILDVKVPNLTQSASVLKQAVLTISAVSPSGSTIGTVTASPDDPNSLALQLSSIPKTTSAGQDYTIQVKVAFPSTADNSTKLQASALDAMQISLRQGQANAPLKPNAQSDFVWTSNTTSSTITGYNGTRKDVVIPETYTVGGASKPVTSIAPSAFTGQQLTSVSMPDTVTNIGSFAFKDNSLTSVKLSTSVKSLGTDAFNGNQLTSVVIPHTVTEIGHRTFANNQLTKVTIPDSVTTLGTAAFFNNKLTSITVPDSVTTIGASSFASNKLTSVKLSSKLTSVTDRLFEDNPELTSIVIPSSVKTIGSYVFNKTPIAKATIAGTVTSFGYDVFDYSGYYLKSIYFEGNAPSSFNSAGSSGSFSNYAADKKVYYHAGATGFTSPMWKGYSSATY
jgi:alternate signal-mediated exported protein